MPLHCCRRHIVLAVLATLLLSVLATPAAGQGLTVAAASSLQAALRELVPVYRRAGHSRVTLVFGASGSLARQIENGAPFDVFLSANAGYVERLAGQGLIDVPTIVAYAEGRLALAVEDPALLADTPDVLDAAALERLRDPEVGVIALANPAIAPYGAAGEAVLRNAGLWEAVEARIVYGENVRQALTYVDTGNAEAGFVAASLVVGTERTWRLVDPALHEPIRQVLGIVAASRRDIAARAFVDFLLGPRGQAILQRHGLGAPRR